MILHGISTNNEIIMVFISLTKLYGISLGNEIILNSICVDNEIMI